jgi:hypothetical protein
MEKQAKVDSVIGRAQERHQREEEAPMKYVVEIESPHGETATKEYEATSIREVVRRVNAELGEYPGFHLLHVNPAPDPLMREFP